MTPRPQRKRTIQLSIALALCTGSLAWAERVSVQRPSVDIVQEKASDSDTVETVKQNTSLEVLAREGKWIKVRTPAGKEGYVQEALIAKKGGGGLDLSALTGGPSASEMSAANAGKGMSEEATQYARQKGYNLGAVQKMQDMRRQYKPELKKFKQDGQVGSK